MSDVIRSEEHETDTEARRLVPTLFPSAWEHREPGGRDYGIDMQVELFEAGKPTGKLLFMQIKGYKGTVNDEDEYHVYDLKTTTLKYSELFAVPFLLVLCPVHQKPTRFYYLWLQEYISVVLDYDNPTWRENKTTVRVKIPTRNKMPGNTERLQYVAGYPQRMRILTKLVHLQNELDFAVTNAISLLKHDVHDLTRASEVLDKMFTLLETHNNEADSLVFELMQWEVLDPIRALLKLLRTGKEITPDELRALSSDIQLPEGQSQDQLVKATMDELLRLVKSILTCIARQFDVEQRRTLFKASDSHQF